MQRLYAELHHLAKGYLVRERKSHTLQPTALVHEAYLRLAQQDRARFQDENHFLRTAAQMMRRALVNHERDRRRHKRGGLRRRVDLDQVDLAFEGPLLDLLALEEGLQRLESFDPRKVEIVHLRFFAGLSLERTAEAVGISLAQVKRDWALAKAWLSREMQGDVVE